MKQEISIKTVSAILSLLVLVGVIGGFLWLWNSSQPAEIASAEIDQKYQRIDISSLKSQAQKLTGTDRINNGELPVEAPTADLVGRENPFANL